MPQLVSLWWKRQVHKHLLITVLFVPTYPLILSNFSGLKGESISETQSRATIEFHRSSKVGTYAHMGKRNSCSVREQMSNVTLIVDIFYSTFKLTYLPKSAGRLVRDISLSPSTVRFLSCTKPVGSDGIGLLLKSATWRSCRFLMLSGISGMSEINT